MIAREWMPNGLLLPWDHYGFSIPTRSCIAYAARRGNDPFYSELLEKQANWAFDQSIGWGFDDLVWALVWWPKNKPQSAAAFTSWSEPEVGAALVSSDARLYAMQMWDESTPIFPTRAHVNPNALVLSAYGSPLTTDGVSSKECTAFNFDDTWREVGYMDLGEKRKFNFGSGCGGAHSILLVDQWEGMRALSDYQQATQIAFSQSEQSVTADVTPIYREKFADALTVRRRTRLCEDRFWLIEDLARFESEHQVTARFFLRPDLLDVPCGVAIETAEGVRLTLLPLLGPDDKTLTPIPGYPERLDGKSLRADFTQSGTECRWLWLAWPEATRSIHQDIREHWQTVPDAKNSLDFDLAREALALHPIDIPLTMPPYLQRDLPVVSRWWFRRLVPVPQGKAWLRLPKQMFNLRLWVDGKAVDIASHILRMDLLEPEIALPPQCAGREVEIVLCCDTGHSQYGPGSNGGSGFYGSPAILVEQPAPGIAHAEYRDNLVIVRSGDKEWNVTHTLMEESR